MLDKGLFKDLSAKERQFDLIIKIVSSLIVGCCKLSWKWYANAKYFVD